MAKRKFKISEEQEKALKAAYQQSQDGATKIRYQAVPLYGQGYQVSEIEQTTGCSRVSLLEWCRPIGRLEPKGNLLSYSI